MDLTLGVLPNYRSSKDSGYGSMNALECKDVMSPMSAMRTKANTSKNGVGPRDRVNDCDPLGGATFSKPSSPDVKVPPKHITSVVVNHDFNIDKVSDNVVSDNGDNDHDDVGKLPSDDNGSKGDVSQSENSDHGNNGDGSCQLDVDGFVEDTNEKIDRNNKNVDSYTELSLVKGIHIKALNVKSKEASNFKRRIFNQKLPEIREEFRSRDAKHERERFLFTPQPKKRKNNTKPKPASMVSLLRYFL